MKKYGNIAYATRDGEELFLDLYTPETDNFDIFIYFHGGGLQGGTKECGATSFIPYLAERGIATASVEYRMYPTHAYPDFLIDAADAVKYVSENISKYGSCGRILVGGSSAGGYISMMLCFDRRWYDGAGVDPSIISAYVHDAGQPTAHFKVLKYRGIDPRRVIIDDTAPLYHICDAVYPPMHLIVSDNDMKNRYEQTMLTLSTLSHFGHTDTVTHTVMHGTHCNYVERIDEDGESAFGKIIIGFINSLNKQSEDKLYDDR